MKVNEKIIKRIQIRSKKIQRDSVVFPNTNEQD